MSTAAHSPTTSVSDRHQVLVDIDGATYRLRRLYWRERNRVINRAVTVDSGAVELAPIAFAQSLVAASVAAVIRDGHEQSIDDGWFESIPTQLGDRLAAAAIELNRRRAVPVEETPRADGSVDVAIADAHYRLAPWTWGLRNRLLAHAASSTHPSVASPDTARFHEAVLRTMCALIKPQIGPESWLDQLDGDIGDALLDIALRMSGLGRHQEAEITEAIRAGRPHHSVTMYMLCREFGWTPQQIHQQSARDIDGLLAVHRSSPRGAARYRSERTDLRHEPASRAMPDANSTSSGPSSLDTMILAVDDSGEPFIP
ncbi:MAG: hypothetical protein AAGC55_21970 [Myxococcota bacterium]